MQKFIFPKYLKKIRIDVGTGSTAPNASLWLKNNKETAVLCFEADPRSYKILINGGFTNQYTDKFRLVKKKYILYRNRIVKKLDNKVLKIFNVAISLSDKSKSNFYLTDKKNFGTSSLLKPLERSLKQKIVKKIKVPVKKLSFFLKKIDFSHFEYIEFLKVDTQGNDLNVLKSCGKYLNKCCFIQAEYWAYRAYKGESTRQECLNSMKKFMESRNFSLYYFTVSDAFFVNKSLKKKVISDKIVDNTIDFEKGLFYKSYFFGIFPGKLVIYAKIIIFLRKLKLFNYLFYKVFKVNFKKFI